MNFLKSYSKTAHLFAGFVAASVAVSMSVSCSKSNGSGKVSIQDDPVGTYGKFLTEIKERDSLSTDELAGQIGRWQTLRDSVFYYAIRDTAGNPHSTMYAKCQLLHDSLMIEFTRLAQSRNRDFKDVFVLIEQTSLYHGDKDWTDAADKARLFFSSLDSLAPISTDKHGILSEYRHLLALTEQNGINGLSDLKTFIRHEDVIFRTFLEHFSSLAGENLSDIMQDTEKCCSQIFLAAEEKELPYRDAVIYMTMRTNRRLIQNTAVCLEDIRENKVRTRLLAWGYACMIMQPYISMDGICMSLLSAREKDALWKLAEQTPEALARLGEVLQSDNEGLAALPGTLIGIYIQTL